MDQTEVFLHEGDEWYKRNKELLINNPEDDVVQRYIRTLDLAGRKVLEVGCSSGHRLTDLAARGAECWGTDISQFAIEDGTKLYPNLRLAQGASHELSQFSDAFFDIAIINFVLHWVDRKHVLFTVSELDRVLKKGGILVVGDWYPDVQHRRPYHHNEALGVYTYKQPYWDIFTASGMYTLLQRSPFTHTFASYASGERGMVDESLTGSDTDGMMVAFRKDAEDRYPVRFVPNEVS